MPASTSLCMSCLKVFDSSTDRQMPGLVTPALPIAGCSGHSCGGRVSIASNSRIFVFASFNSCSNCIDLFFKHCIRLVFVGCYLHSSNIPARPSSIFKTYGKTNTPNNNPININLRRMVYPSRSFSSVTVATFTRVPQS